MLNNINSIFGINFLIITDRVVLSLELYSKVKVEEIYIKVNQL
ncbi:MAG: hypothetical protein Pg6B_02450 [Candidatus Azobacteroides pseudotrichonymphae]|nr:MAG: hypothetical protein Pg6B_02450 [Candidatus Azobacteroides pseudotrichonymphae]